MGWQRASGYNWRALVEADIGRYKRVIGDALTLGYDVLTARNGPEAVALLRRNSCVSVLFTDIQMPGMGGEELAAIALMLRPRIRVVFTSGFRTPPPNAVFIPKPYKAVELIRVLPPQPLTSYKS